MVNVPDWWAPDPPGAYEEAKAAQNRYVPVAEIEARFSPALCAAILAEDPADQPDWERELLKPYNYALHAVARRAEPTAVSR
jgi:hypothetical protein